MTAADRRKCPHCGKRVSRNLAGTLRAHLGRRTGQRCPGSGLMTR